MIDVDEHRCVDCMRLIPVERKYCYLCDLLKNGKAPNTPKNIHDLVDEFMNNADLSDYEASDIIDIFDKFEKHVEKKKYRITIQ